MRQTNNFHDRVCFVRGRRVGLTSTVQAMAELESRAAGHQAQIDLQASTPHVVFINAPGLGLRCSVSVTQLLLMLSQQ